MATDDNMDAVMKRVQKLLAIAQDSRGSAAEAAAAAGMAERIMAKYKLEHQDILIAELTRGEAFGESVLEAPRCGIPRDESTWYGRLGVAIARVNDSHCEWADKGMLRFYGVKSDVEISQYMIMYLADQVRVATAAFYALTKDKERAANFRFGMVAELCTALKAMRPAAESANALVVAKSAAVQAHFGRTMTVQRGQRHSATGDSAMGAVAGSRVDVARRGVTGGGGSGPLRLA